MFRDKVGEATGMGAGVTGLSFIFTVKLGAMSGFGGEKWHVLCFGRITYSAKLCVRIKERRRETNWRSLQ